MDAELKQKWLTALRSGEYKQAKRKLRRDTPEGPTYCCLGVLCQVAGVPIDGDGVYCQGSDPLEGYAPIDAIIGNEPNYGVLTEMNDRGDTFLQIADVIEKDY